LRTTIPFKPLSLLLTTIASANPCGFVSVADFIDPARDTTAADTTRAVRSAIASAASEKHGEKSVFFPAGRYRLTESVLLPTASIRLFGETAFGHYGTCADTTCKRILSGSTLEWADPDSARSRFLVRAPRLGTTYASFENLAFQGDYLLDLSTALYDPDRARISNCAFSSVSRDTAARGIAVNLVNHDFSVIEESTFSSFFGGCAVRIWGGQNLQRREKLTTQVKVRDCDIGGKAKIGISADWVNSLQIQGCDFSASDFMGIDIGSEGFHKLYPDTSDRRAYPAGDVAYPYWGAIGITQNHFENYTIGVNARGSQSRCIGLLVDGNDFVLHQAEQDRSQRRKIIFSAVRIFDAVDAATRHNEIATWYGEDFPEHAKATPENVYRGITYRNCINARFLFDNFFLRGAKAHLGKATIVDYFDSSSAPQPRFRAMVAKGHNSSSHSWDDPDLGPTEIDAALSVRLGSRSSISGRLPEMGGTDSLPGAKYDIVREISTSGLIGGTERIRLIDSISPTNASILFLQVHPNHGPISSEVWLKSSGSNTLVRLSKGTEKIDYLLEADHRSIILKSTSKSKRTASVSGLFLGLR
jgi:hypothetical protein